MIATTTYTYGTLAVIVQAGIVTRSDTELCVVGKKPNTAALVACGWKRIKAPTTYYSHGGTNPNRFTK